jgi:hypothetical protein
MKAADDLVFAVAAVLASASVDAVLLPASPRAGGIGLLHAAAGIERMP